jgi:hypothetical protein
MRRPGSVDTGTELANARRLNKPAVVLVSRAGRGWQAEVAALGVVRRARSLLALHRRMRELLGTADIDYRFYTGDRELDSLVMRIRAARAAARRNEERARQLTVRAVQLPASGSGRDLAVLVGMSHQRINDLQRRVAAQLSTMEGKT